MTEHEQPTGFTAFDDLLTGGARLLLPYGPTRASAQAQRNGLLDVAISPIEPAGKQRLHLTVI